VSRISHPDPDLSPSSTHSTHIHAGRAKKLYRVSAHIEIVANGYQGADHARHAQFLVKLATHALLKRLADLQANAT
jgi:hypothetical protein